MGNQKQGKLSEKSKSILITISVILVAAIVIGLTIYTRLGDNGTLLRGKTAAESENFEVSGTMMAYFYNQNYQNYASYLSLLGVDTSVSLKQQACSYAEGGTWFHYFASMTKDYVSNLLAICEAAKANGITLSDEDMDNIDIAIENIEAEAEYYGYNANQYLAAVTGSGLNLKDVRECLELTVLASNYATVFRNSLSYTDDQLEEYYEANTDDFEGVDYYYYTVYSSDFMSKDADGNPVGDTATASASAQAAALEISAATNVEEFLSLVKNYATTTLAQDEETAQATVNDTFVKHATAGLIADVSDWMFSAEKNEVTMTGEEGETSFSVYILAEKPYRDEDATKNVKHILFTNSTYEDSSKAEEVYAEWEAAGFSDEKFAELVELYSEDTGSVEADGLYENVTEGSTVAEFNAWIFDSARQAGDHAIVESADYGWHIMNFVGDGDKVTWEVEATEALEQADYDAMIEANSGSITFDDDVIYEINA